MAGTRLFIQTMVVLEILLLVGIALWFGLCRTNDQLCTPLIAQGGRAVLHTNPIDLGPLQLPKLKILVATSEEAELWAKAVSEYDTNDDLNVLVMDADLVKRICADPTSADSAEQEAIYICPANQANEQVTQTKTSVIVFPAVSSQSNPAELIRKILPRRSNSSLPMQLHSLKVTLQVEHGVTNWQVYASSLQKWMDQAALTDWPCWKQHAVQVEVVFGGDLSSKVVPVANSTSGLVDTREIQSWIKTRRTSLESSTVELILYVAHTNTSESSAVQVGDTLVIFADTSASSEDTMIDTLNNSLGYVVPFVQNQVLGLAFADNTALTSSALPSWYTTLWMQRILKDTYNNARDTVNSMRTYMLQTSYDVAITKEVSSMWLQAVKVLDQGLQAARAGDWTVALNSFQEAIDQVETLQTHPEYLLPPKDFSPEHAMAVFAPLLFPLLVPMIAQLVREYKRFKELKNKKVA